MSPCHAPSACSLVDRTRAGGGSTASPSSAGSRLGAGSSSRTAPDWSAPAGLASSSRAGAGSRSSSRPAASTSAPSSRSPAPSSAGSDAVGHVAGQRKAAGNAAFKARQWQAAAEHYLAGVMALQESLSSGRTQAHDQLAVDLSNNMAMACIKQAEEAPARKAGGFDSGVCSMPALAKRTPVAKGMQGGRNRRRIPGPLTAPVTLPPHSHRSAPLHCRGAGSAGDG